MGKRFGKGSTGEDVTYGDQRKDGRKSLITLETVFQPNHCYMNTDKSNFPQS